MSLPQGCPTAGALEPVRCWWPEALGKGPQRAGQPSGCPAELPARLLEGRAGLCKPVGAAGVLCPEKALAQDPRLG